MSEFTFPWFTGRLHGFDLETTGVDVETARIVTATFTTVSTRGVESTETWLVDPGIEIPEQAASVHGITTEHAREHGIPPAEALARIRTHLNMAHDAGEPVAVYNVPYDFTLFDRELRRHLGTAFYDIPFVLDPLVLDKKINRFIKGKGARKLINTAKRYGVVLTEEEAHTSAGDVLATCRLLWRMMQLRPGVFNRSMVDMQDAQRQWHHDQTTDFAGWLTRQGKAEDAAQVLAEAGQWPLRPLAVQSTA